ncbi:hypothetical protein [Burkholderia multivorans]|uniref:hypothetical protein n=1 Tax=Burkholderia multivorans TaxID=87883 RepID=UPI0019044924|nr:hypothetical protein [Burkholderia multivorans]HDR8953381.1 hypothetical protein [Burkholderia vietnamiensis]MBJ9658332.1 hypothetical protein [Burkholderia multivorans]MBU9147516.1 hypothetical protein [Burkholderia multivorans]MBU9525030.1 hypothetical protein [Burkholderia multivorans]MBU9537023.1 hypothetical protein [Burkholderia multivorans]
MNELIPIRQWLLSSRGRWSKIAAQAGISTKTVQRIAHGEVDSINLKTYVALRDLMASSPSESANQVPA